MSQSSSKGEQFGYGTNNDKQQIDSLQHRKELEEWYRRQLEEAQRVAEGTADLSRNILTELSIQNETLAASEDNLESTEYVARKAMRTLRGMTFSGSIYNMFTSDPNPDGNAAAPSNNRGTDASEAQTIFRPPNGYNSSQKDILLQGNKANPDDDLIPLAKVVDELHAMSVAMTDSLETQNETLERIDDKMEKVHSDLLSVTIKSSKLANSSRKKSGYLGRFEFVDMDTSMYLAVNDDDELLLTHFHTRAAYFDIFSRNENLLGLQSTKTLKFLRVNAIGSVGVHGEYFGRYEEVFLELYAGKPTGILITSKNWGYGGWLKRPVGESDSQSDGPANMIVNTTTTSIHDKEGILLLLPKLVTIDM